MKEKVFRTAFALVLVLPLFSNLVVASGDPPQIDGFFTVLNNAVAYILTFITLATFAMMLYGAYVWMASAGDPQKVKMAQGILTWAVLGLVFFMIIALIYGFVLGSLGFEDITILPF